jgi:PAS domain-containing protein
MTGRRDEMTAPWDREDSASLKLLRLIAQSTNDGIWDWDLETDEVYYSPRWLELVGYLPGELPGHIDTFIKLLSDYRRRGALAQIRRVTRRTYQLSALMSGPRDVSAPVWWVGLEFDPSSKYRPCESPEGIDTPEPWICQSEAQFW